VKGPRSLKELLKRFRPGRTQAGLRVSRVSDDRDRANDTAFSAVSAAWETSVGANVAARSRPLKLRAGVLTVLTASSAWSDQLTLLAPRILQALHAACPDAPLRRLRFTVASGRSTALLEGVRPGLRAPSPATPAPFWQPKRAPAASVPEEDVSALVSRLAALQSQLDTYRDEEGWRTCGRCGKRFEADVPSVAVCGPCAEAGRSAQESLIERTLMQAPWLSAHELARSVHEASEQTVERVRRRLRSRWESELDSAKRRLRRNAITPADRVMAWGYVMLVARLPQGAAGPAVVENVLGREWSHALLHGSQTDAGEARRLQREKYRQ
jgi:Dna[CI] antecedent, DciA